MSDTPTPRTDKETWETIAGAFKCQGANGDMEGKGEYVKTEFARQLERDLAKIETEYQKQVSVTIAQQNQIGQLRNEIARLNGQTNFYCECGGVSQKAIDLNDENYRLRQQLENNAANHDLERQETLNIIIEIAEKLQKLFDKPIFHAKTCSKVWSKECSCGLDAALKKVREL